LKQASDSIRLLEQASDDLRRQQVQSITDHELRVDFAGRAERDRDVVLIGASSVPIEPLCYVRGYGNTRPPKFPANLESLGLWQEPNGAVDVD